MRVMIIPREPRTNVRGLRRDYTPSPQISEAYLLGVLHDATVRKNTYRIATKNKEFAEILKKGILDLRRKASDFADEDIVHACRKTRTNINKVSVLEGADGSPPF